MLMFGTNQHDSVKQLPSIKIKKITKNSIIRKVKVKLLSRVRLFATPWMVTYQAPQSMGFSRQEYWSGLPFPSPGYLSNPGIEPGSPTLQTDSLPSVIRVRAKKLTVNE